MGKVALKLEAQFTTYLIAKLDPDFVYKCDITSAIYNVKILVNWTLSLLFWESGFC